MAGEYGLIVKTLRADEFAVLVCDEVYVIRLGAHDSTHPSCLAFKLVHVT